MNPAIHCAQSATIATTTALTTTAAVAGATTSVNRKKKKGAEPRKPIGTLHVHGKQNENGGDNGIASLVFTLLGMTGIALIIVFVGFFVVSLAMHFVDLAIGAGEKSGEFIQEVVKDTAHGITNGVKSGYGYVSGRETVEFDGKTFVIPKGYHHGIIDNPYKHLKIYQDGSLAGDFSGTFLFHMDDAEHPKEITVIGKTEDKFEKTVYKSDKLEFVFQTDFGW